MNHIDVAAPQFEHHGEALGIGESSPRITFEVEAAPGWTQHAYEIETTTAGETLTSGRIDSTESVLVPWSAAPLASRQSATVRVRVWGEAEEPSDWSAGAKVEAGLLDPTDWVATAISPSFDDASASQPLPLLRRAFHVDEKVLRARLYITAHGLYEAEVNGEKVGRDAFNPGWTSYSTRLRYHTYDVTHMLRPGENALGAWLSDGWYTGRLGFHGGKRNRYGDRVALLAQLAVDYADGRQDTLATDERWRAGIGPLLSSGIYDGETYDARLVPTGWSQPDFDDSTWSGVETVERQPNTLVAPDGPPVRCTQDVRPIKVWTAPSGATLVDFGQNLVGRLRIRVTGRAGDTIRLRHAEVLQHGELYTRPLREAKATDVYVLSGTEEPEVWEPRFTFHGFRYAEVTGWTGDDVAANLVARVYHSDMGRIGHFSCSNPLINRLHENVVWSMRGNFVDVPTDCPQRDERLGWTGDIQVFAPTATFLYRCAGMLRSWLKDVAAEQLPDGTVPWYVPFITTNEEWTPPRPGAVWGDVAVLTPWDLYEATGDDALLAQQYPSAKAWVDLVDRLAGPDHVWDDGFQLGDWLDPTAPAEDPRAAMTDPYLVATGYFAWSAHQLARSAEVLGHVEDAADYRQLAQDVRSAFCTRYLEDDGWLTSDTQTAYAIALRFDLLPQGQRAFAGERLAELVRKADNRIATGFAGTHLILDALTATGHADTAYDLLLEEESPSWLSAVKQDGTTTWERWDSMLPDGRVHPGEMTSFNHYAYGSVAAWLHTTVAGLAPAAAGYRRIRFRPLPGGRMGNAEARVVTPYGLAGIRWELAADKIHLSLDVPTGTEATLQLPGHPDEQLGSGHHEIVRQFLAGEEMNESWQQ